MCACAHLRVGGTGSGAPSHSSVRLHEKMSDLNFLSFDSGGYAAAGGAAGGGAAGGGAAAGGTAGGFDGGLYGGGGVQPGGYGGMMMGGDVPQQPGYAQQQQQGFAQPPMSVPVSGTMSNAFGANAGYSFDDEPPLLEELGIDLGLILRKSTAMLRPHGLPPESLLDGDLIGPVFFCLLLATAHLLAGKVLFGYVLGWSLVSSFVTSTVLGMLTPASDGAGAGTGGNLAYGDGGGAMSGHDMGKMTGIGGGGAGKQAASNGVEFGMTASLLGYSMLPMVGGTVIASLIPRGPVPTAVVFLCVLWSSRTCSSLMTIVTPSLKSVYWLVLYPCILFYSVYALLALY